MILPRASTHLNPALLTVCCFVHLWEILKRFRSKSQSTDYWRHYKEVIARRYFENDANAAISVSWLNQFTKQQRTYGHIQVASVYNSYTARSTDNVYNMYKIMMMTTTNDTISKIQQMTDANVEKKEKENPSEKQFAICATFATLLLLLFLLLGITACWLYRLTTR